MAEPLATIADVEQAFRPLTGDEGSQAQHLLVLASALIRNEVPGVDDRLGAGDLDTEVVSNVVAAIVIRGLRNPDGARQKSETVGPFTHSSTYADTVSQLSLLPYERRLLAPATGRLAGLGTIRVQPGLAPPPGDRTPLPPADPWWFR